MFNFAGNVTDEKTNKSRFVVLMAEEQFWRDAKRIRYHRINGQGILVKRLRLDIKSIFPILFSHVGCIKNNTKDSSKTTGRKVYLTKFNSCTWITHKKELFHCGHGLHLVLKNFEILPGDYRRYLVLSSVEKLYNPVTFRFIEEIRYGL